MIKHVAMTLRTVHGVLLERLYSTCNIKSLLYSIVPGSLTGISNWGARRAIRALMHLISYYYYTVLHCSVARSLTEKRLGQMRQALLSGVIRGLGCSVYGCLCQCRCVLWASVLHRRFVLITVNSALSQRQGKHTHVSVPHTWPHYLTRLPAEFRDGWRETRIPQAICSRQAGRQQCCYYKHTAGALSKQHSACDRNVCGKGTPNPLLPVYSAWLSVGLSKITADWFIWHVLTEWFCICAYVQYVISAFRAWC